MNVFVIATILLSHTQLIVSDNDPQLGCTTFCIEKCISEEDEDLHSFCMSLFRFCCINNHGIPHSECGCRMTL
jgi:hypothetical protein